MEETNTAQTEAIEEPQGTEETTDWKAEARKWEARAKKNSAAAEELEALKQAQMTEQEKLQARAEKAEARIAELEADALRKATAQRLAAEKHVPIDLLLYCTDETAMEAFAETYAAQQSQTPAAPSAPASRIVRDSGGKPTNGELFADFLRSQLS